MIIDIDPKRLTFITSKNSITLEDAHYQHLLDEGFNDDQILALEGWGLESISRTQALKRGIKLWDGNRHISDGGLYFPFGPEYGQVRFNTPLEGPDGPVKYLGPSKPCKAWYPEPEVEAFTEGWKDAAAPTVKGIPTGAIVGVDNIIHCLPQDCQIPIIFDSDGWRNPNVMRGLVWGALWTNAPINLFPANDKYPNGGACEFFKAGGTISEYQALIDEARSPHDLLEEWVTHWDKFDDDLRGQCARVLDRLSYALENADKFVHRLEQKVEDKRNKWIARQ